jgi:hypothetical protein
VPFVAHAEQTFEYLFENELRRTGLDPPQLRCEHLIVKSLGPHLSIGGRATASTRVTCMSEENLLAPITTAGHASGSATASAPSSTTSTIRASVRRWR